MLRKVPCKVSFVKKAYEDTRSEELYRHLLTSFDRILFHFLDDSADTLRQFADKVASCNADRTPSTRACGAVCTALRQS